MMIDFITDTIVALVDAGGYNRCILYFDDSETGSTCCKRFLDTDGIVVAACFLAECQHVATETDHTFCDSLIA